LLHKAFTWVTADTSEGSKPASNLIKTIN